MYETEPSDILIPEDHFLVVCAEDELRNHHSLTCKTAIHQYKVSTESSSNIASLILYNDIWLQNQQSFMENCNVIVNSVQKITQNVDTSKMTTWKSSLNKFTDPISLFEKSSANCANGCQDSISANGLNLFENKQCTYGSGIKQNTFCRKINQESKKRSFFTKSLNSDSSNDESKSAEDLGPSLKPKYGNHRPVSVGTSLVVSNYDSYPDTDLIKENDKFSYKKKPYQASEVEQDELDYSHKQNVAKITFKTAKEQLLASNPAAKRTLGTSRKAQAKFISPMIGAQDKQEPVETEISDERLKHIDPKMVELIESEIIDKGNPVGWDDIAGLHLAKSVIQEAVVWPLLRPDIFTGLRRPPKGILLFGPPGTGKTLIGKCVAAQCRATFFSISASSLTSKWIGDGEKMVRALFAVARTHQPAVIFIDEIDSLLTQRSDTEHEATRRIKTEFLVQFDGAPTADEDRLLIVGATNRPHELDEAARRRLVKRLYIPLPDAEARQQIIWNLLQNERHSLSSSEAAEVAALSHGYSGADVKALCSEAAMGPVRAVPLDQIVTIQKDKVRPVNIQDFKNALQRVRPSVSQDDLGQYVKWNNTYGQGF